MNTTRDELRRAVRARRRQIPINERVRAARNFALAADRCRLLRASRRIALYEPFGHEADVRRLLKRAIERGCAVYLPVVTHVRASRMQFVRVRPGMRLQKNRFGILEPVFRATDVVSPRGLDVIFMPLVAFDRSGWRLGSGAGFYDRALAHLRRNRRWRRPLLVGIGYELQCVASVDPHSWDVPMDAVLTETRVLRFPRQPAGRPS